MMAVAILSILLTLNPGTAICQPNTETKNRCPAVIIEQDISGELEALLLQHKGVIDPPVICNIRMPRKLWWFTLVASEVTGADPLWVASVMRFESDFREEYSWRSSWFPPMNIHRDFVRKFPAQHLFGNILTGARRLAMFNSIDAALPGYNKDRSPNFPRYCRAVKGGISEARRTYVRPLDDSAWRAAVGLARIYLAGLELKAAAYSGKRRN